MQLEDFSTLKVIAEREMTFFDAGREALADQEDTPTRRATKDPRKNAVPTSTTRGPGGTRVRLAREIPTTALVAPRAALRNPYRERLPLTFRAAAAGRIT